MPKSYVPKAFVKEQDSNILRNLHHQVKYFVFWSLCLAIVSYDCTLSSLPTWLHATLFNNADFGLQISRKLGNKENQEKNISAMKWTSRIWNILRRMIKPYAEENEKTKPPC